MRAARTLVRLAWVSRTVIASASRVTTVNGEPERRVMWRGRRPRRTGSRMSLRLATYGCQRLRSVPVAVIRQRARAGVRNAPAHHFTNLAQHGYLGRMLEQALPIQQVPRRFNRLQGRNVGVVAPGINTCCCVLSHSRPFAAPLMRTCDSTSAHDRYLAYPKCLP